MNMRDYPTLYLYNVLQ